jgi:hypothetical protein
MHFADHPRDSADLDREPEPRTSHRSDEEVVVERVPIAADSASTEADVPSASIASERRRSERRRIDRMSTGI